MKIVLISALALMAYTCSAQTQPAAAKHVSTTAKTTAPNHVSTKSDTLKIVTDTSWECTIMTAASSSKSSIKPRVVEYAEIDLDTASMPLPFLIKAPVGSTISFDQGVVVTAPDTTFSILIDMSYSEMPASIAQRKKDAQDNPVAVFSKFIIDKPDVLLYEAKNMGRSEYHFEMARDIKGTRYYLHDQWIQGHSFTQKQIEAMMKAASEAHPKP